jgi:hypothetical protein
MTCPAIPLMRRTVLVAITSGVALAAVLVVGREFFGGRGAAFWLENTGGVWLLSAFLAGWFAGRAIPGAVAGLGALFLAVFFYESISLVTDDGFSVQFIPLFRPVWVAASLVAGAGLGFLGGWSADDDEWRWLGTSLLGALLVAEAVGLFVDGPPHPGFDSGAAATQIFVGTGVMLCGVRGRVRFRALALFLGVTLLLLAVELMTGMITISAWG